MKKERKFNWDRNVTCGFLNISCTYSNLGFVLACASASVLMSTSLILPSAVCGRGIIRLKHYDTWLIANKMLKNRLFSKVMIYFGWCWFPFGIDTGFPSSPMEFSFSFLQGKYYLNCFLIFKWIKCGKKMSEKVGMTGHG